MSTLPLFPLGKVLTPGEHLPLQIFERRYIVMLRDVLRGGEGSEFGVVALRAGAEVGEDAPVQLYGVGCSATLAEVNGEKDGTFLITVRGVRRFRLDGMVEGRTPYHCGYVTWLHDRCRDAELVAQLAQRLRGAVGGYRRQFGLDPASLPEDPTELSHEAARQVMLDRSDRQVLLEARDVDTRLRMALAMVRRETVLQRELGAFPGRYAPTAPAMN